MHCNYAIIKNEKYEQVLLTNIFAICPTIDPTAPAAPLTNTVSPALGLQMSIKPKYAVKLEGKIY